MPKNKQKGGAALARLGFELSLTLFIIHDVPLIGWITPAPIFITITLLSFFFSILFMTVRTFGKYLIRSLPVTAAYILLLLLHLFSGGESFATVAYGYLQLIICIIVGQYLMESENIILAKRILFVLAVVYITTAITTHIGLQEYPNASRELATGADGNYSEFFGQYAMMNIGGFDYCYHITLALPLLIGLFKNKIGNRLVLLAIIATFAIIIFETQYATALLVVLISLSLFFAQNNFNQKKGIRFFFFSIVFIIIGLELIALLLTFISNIVESEILSSRLEDIVAVITTGKLNVDVSDDSDVGFRMSAYTKSWEAFAGSGALGTWKLGTAGGHSYFLDCLALYGIAGFVVFIVMWASVWRRYLRVNRNKPWYGYCLFTYLAAILLSILNTHIYLYITGFIIPIFSVLFNGLRSPSSNEK